MPDTRPLGIFDSGVGGITVTKEIIKVLPNESMVYFGDTGRVPYGTRSNDTIIRYARQDESFLLSKDAKLIVAACGTVSSVASCTKDELPVPFFEVVSSAARAAVAATACKKIGVIGTPATVRSESHKKSIKAIDGSIEVFANACPMFVPLVENKITDPADAVVKEFVRRYLEPIKSNNVDTLILGCTHYPALSKAISEYMGCGVKLINPGFAVAQEIKSYLESHSMLSNNTKADRKYYVSDDAVGFSQMASSLLDDESIIAKQVELNG